MMRNSIMNAAELASYDQIKSSILLKFPSLNPDIKALHFICALSAGFIAVCVASPVDVIKTRVMNVSFCIMFRSLMFIMELSIVLLKL